MTEALILLLRIAGTGLVLLALAHIPIGRHLRWREDGARLAPVNAAIFRVHNFFISLGLVLMGLPCIFDPRVFVETSRAGAWLSWSLTGFWATRLYFQWFVYQADLWRGKRTETYLHWGFTLVWLALTALFALCGSVQAGWLGVHFGAGI